MAATIVEDEEKMAMAQILHSTAKETVILLDFKTNGLVSCCHMIDEEKMIIVQILQLATQEIVILRGFKINGLVTCYHNSERRRKENYGLNITCNSKGNSNFT